MYGSQLAVKRQSRHVFMRRWTSSSIEATAQRWNSRSAAQRAIRRLALE
jgi:hypothetical protein